jgi:hypothetical protein
MCVYYIGIDPMVIRDQRSHCLMVGHYKTYIISSLGHPMLDSVILLVLWTVACNGQGTGIVLHVPQDNVNPTENR